MNGMMKTIVLTSLLLAVASTANAEDEKSLVDTGTLFVHGDLQENTCRMTMDSAWQDVNLGTTSRAEVDHAGKAAEPVKVNIYLHDCPELASWSKNITPMTTTFSTLQPPYSARFMGVQDDYNPDLIKVVGASGIGLRLRDSKGATVMLSHNSDSILLNPGQNQLTFTLQPERTTAPFVAGPYHALVNFSMIYQ